MRKKVGWRARALYIVFALALVVSMVPLLAASVVAQTPNVNVTGTTYTKIGEQETFTATTDPAIATGDNITWTSSGTPAGPITAAGNDATTVFTLDVTFNTEGANWVKCVAEFGLETREDTHVVGVGDGLIPQIAWNVLGTDETFCVPSPTYDDSVQVWSAIPTLGLNGSWDWVGGDPNIGGPPLADCVTVRGLADGELHLYAETDVDADGEPGNDTLHGVKKWGKINVTEIYWVDDKDTSSSADDEIVMKSTTNAHEAMPGTIDGDMVIGSGKTQIVWDEEAKEFEGEEEFQELVIGTFPLDDPIEHPANGAEVFWWLLAANAPVYDLVCNNFSTIEAALDAMQIAYPTAHTNFAGDDQKTMTVSGDDTTWGPDGYTSVTVNAEGEEAIKIVVVARYPEDGLDPEEPEWIVCPEIISWNFWTQQLEKVPQVRWAGEKIVLEKEFGSSFAGYEVLFSLENQSPGCLEPLSSEGGASGCQEAWTECDSDGVAKIILVSESPGEVDVDLAIFDPTGYEVFNQHGFVVFFLKFEELELSNVVGERVDNPLTAAIEGHDSGIWDPENPFDPSADVDEETLNVSEDTMLRARVKGWFMGDDLSVRPVATLDLDGDTVADMTLPAGRWVLPDDWPALAGPFWQQFRPHWDIMTQPNDDVMSDSDGVRAWDPVLMSWAITTPADKAEELGLYGTWITNPVTGVSLMTGVVAMAPVIGPYSSLDNYTPAVNTVLGRKTIVQNAKLNWWDAPMPPAKIIFAVENGPGFFKETDKGDVYYQLHDLDGVVVPVTEDPADTILYTNPFYQIHVPASDEIPAFVNNGGYDWDSWEMAYGPYDFWEIFNQPPGFTPDDPQHPTMVEVYSDNHGEAMAYLNGDWNLDLSAWLTNGAYDVPVDTEVGITGAVAIADYPYFRKHPVVVSGNVTKTWEWGKEILGTDPADYNDGSTDADSRMVFQVGTFTSLDDDPPGDGLSDKKMAFVWVCDRDGVPNVGEQIDWAVTGTDARISGMTGEGVSQYLPDIDVENGFLAGTAGVITDAPTGVRGTSYTKMPNAAELALFDKFYGIANWHHAVAAVELYNSEDTEVNLDITLYEEEGQIKRDWNIDWADADDPDDPLMRGDADMSGGVNMGDVTTVERIILGLNTPTTNADANDNGTVDMGDVTKIERIILGL